MHISASRLERVLYCGGSFEMEQPLAAPAPTQDQRDGDAAHEAAQMLLTGQVNAADLVGRKMSNGVFVTQDMIDHVEEYVTHVTGWTGFESDMTAVVRYEHESTIACRTDAFNVTDNMVEVADLKFGWRLVEVYPNFQMIAYAIAARQLFPHATTYRLTIAQPRPYHQHGTLRSHDMTADQVDEYALRIAQVIEARDPKTLKTGNHCRYCRAYDDCAAVNSAVFNAVDVAVRTDLSPRGPKALSQCVTDLRRAKELIDECLNVVEDQAISTIEGGAYVPGYSIAPSLGNYAWTAGLTAEAVQAATGIDPRADKMVSPAQLKKKGANADIVKALTHRPNLGFKLKQTKSADPAFKKATKGKK